jgi:hypothetical protein
VCSSERSTERTPDTIQVFENFHNRYDKWFTRHQWVYRSEIEAVSKLTPQEGLGLDVGVGIARESANNPVIIDGFQIEATAKLTTSSSQQIRKMRSGNLNV